MPYGCFDMQVVCGAPAAEAGRMASSRYLGIQYARAERVGGQKLLRQ